MALGKTQRNNDLQAYSLKLKLKNGEKFLDKPEFEVKKREGKDFVPLAERQDEVSGQLIGVEPREYVFEGDPIRSFSLSLQDLERGEIYFVSIPLNSLGRSLANSLLALTKFDNISIGLYATKPKEKGGKSYPAASLRQDDEIIRWKYELGQLPAPKVVKFKGKEQKDYTDQELFFVEELKALNNLIKNSDVPASPKPESSEGKGEDIPF